jgi:adenylylsulfate kinase
MNELKNLHPVFDQIMTRDDKENLLRQRSKVIWFTGLSGAGKTTLAKELEKRLHLNGYLTQVLDGDNIRTGINNNLTFTEADRLENIHRIAEVSKLLIHSGVITINSFISPTDEIRHKAMEIIGREDFIEIYVSTPLEVCEQREVKGLYEKARRGEIKNFTGIDSPFEPPKDPDVDVDTSQLSIEASIEKISQFLIPKISYWV